MFTFRLAACLLAASLPSAFGQSAPSPCPATESTTTKLKRGVGNALKNTPLGRTISGGTAPATPAPCSTAPAPSSTSSSTSENGPSASATSAGTVESAPVPLPDDQQPKPGTVRTVKYQGQDIAIATGKDGNTNAPVTYVIIPGTVRPAVKITTDPNVYVSVSTPPTIYTINDGVLTIAEPKKPKRRRTASPPLST